MALLEMVNSVRGKLREERIDAISSSDLLTTEIIDLINDAGSEILEGNSWQFDVRHDGMLWYPAAQTGTGLSFRWATLVTSSNQVDLFFNQDDASGEVFEDDSAIDVAGYRMASESIRSRLRVTNSSLANTAWIVSDVTKNISTFRLTITGNFNLANSGFYNWQTYCNELVLPSTVKDVLSVRNEEEPLRLEFANRELEFDSRVPRAADHFSTVPEVITVGSTITSTSRTEGTGTWGAISDTTATDGICAMVWPVPSADLHLEYSYRVQHSDLSAATDEWAGVPANIIRAVEWLAVQRAFESGIQNDPAAARQAERQVEKRIARALVHQSSQPNRRRIPTSFGPRHYGSARHRWASQTITAPS